MCPVQHLLQPYPERIGPGWVEHCHLRQQFSRRSNATKGQTHCYGRTPAPAGMYQTLQTNGYQPQLASRISAINSSGFQLNEGHEVPYDFHSRSQHLWRTFIFGLLEALD